MSKLPTVVFKYGSASSMIGEAMSVATTGSSGSLQAEVIDIRMDINDDDEDVVIAKVSITNEAPVPMGGLDVAVITHLGAKHHSQEGVTSLGPGIQRDWTFEFPLDSGEWTFVLTGSSSEIKIGPFAFDFEYSATQGRKLSSNIGSSLFTGAFDLSLGDFGKVKEREMIDSSKVVLTSYSAENSRGGETTIKADIDKLSTGLTSTSGNDARDAPILNANPVRDAPLSQPSRTEDPLLAHNPSSSSVRESPVGPSPPAADLLTPLTPPTPAPAATTEAASTPVPLPPAGPPSPPSGPPTPPTGPPSPPTGPPTPPSGPPLHPSLGLLPAGPPGPPAGRHHSAKWTIQVRLQWTSYSTFRSGGLQVLLSSKCRPPSGPPAGPPSRGLQPTGPSGSTGKQGSER